MLPNLKSLVLRTDITNRSEAQEHNPRSPSSAPVLPPLRTLPSIAITTPSGETTPGHPPPFTETPTATTPTNSAYWKEQEAALDRQNEFVDMSPLAPPPAYTSSTVPPSVTDQNRVSARQRRLQLPKINSHTRVSSINPAKSPIDVRRWHEKRRNIAYISGVSIALLIIALVLNYAYVVPHLRKPPSTNDMEDPLRLEGSWNMSNIRLETVSEQDTTVVDRCASRETEFTRCVDSRFLQPGVGAGYSFDLKENDDGSFNGLFGAGIFEMEGSTEVSLTPSRFGLMTKYWYSGEEDGKLSEDGCIYVRGVQLLITVQNDKPTYKITEKQMVQAHGGCILPRGLKDDICGCTFIGTRA